MAVHSIDRFEQIDLQVFWGKRRMGRVLGPRSKILACVYGPHIIGTTPLNEETIFDIPLAFARIASMLQQRFYQDFPHPNETSRRLHELHRVLKLAGRNKNGIEYPYTQRVFEINT